MTEAADVKTGPERSGPFCFAGGPLVSAHVFFALLARLDRLGVIYNKLLGARRNLASLDRGSRFLFGNWIAKSLDRNAILEFQEDEEC